MHQCFKKRIPAKIIADAPLVAVVVGGDVQGLCHKDLFYVVIKSNNSVGGNYAQGIAGDTITYTPKNLLP
jgi:hypothetical protein